MGLLDGGIQALVGSALSSLLLDVTYTDVTPGGYTPGTGQTNTETDYSCKGFVEDDTQIYIDRGLIAVGDRVVTITQTSLSVTPAKGDKVTIRGVTSTVQDIAQDPAQATWILGVTP